MLQLEQNPDLIRQYRYFHSREGIWPEILQGIKDSGILEMEIYLLDHYLCMIVDLPEDLSWQEAMVRMANVQQPMLEATRNGYVWNEFFICTPIKPFLYAQRLIHLSERLTSFLNPLYKLWC